jgi:hypothetical protein
LSKVWPPPAGNNYLQILEEKMAVSKEEMLADLRKARIRKFIYFFAGIGLFVLGVALLAAFAVRRRDWGALILGVIGFVWGAIMLNQARHTRDIEEMIRQKLEELEAAGAPQDSGASEPAGAGAPGGQTALAGEGSAADSEGDDKDERGDAGEP